MKSERKFGVAHVIGQLDYGGAELLAVQIARLQILRGWRVAVLVLGDADPQLVEDLRTNGAEVVVFKARRYSPTIFLRLLQFLRSQAWDTVHAHLFPALYWCALITLCTKGQIRWIYTEHSTDNQRRSHKVLAYIERTVYRRYHAVVAVSDATKQALQSWIPELAVTVIENGVNVGRFVPGNPAPRKPYKLSDDDVVILSIGRFREEKNQAALIEALQHLSPEYKLVLVGDGPEKPRLVNLCRRIGLLNRVHFLGALHDVVPILRSSDIYVLPSLFEGFGISAVEAYLTGLPVVYSDIPGLRDVFSGIGFPVDPQDAQSICNGIKQVAQCPIDKQLRAATDLAMREKYSLERVAAQYEDVYRA